MTDDTQPTFDGEDPSAFAKGILFLLLFWLGVAAVGLFCWWISYGHTGG